MTTYSPEELAAQRYPFKPTDCRIIRKEKEYKRALLIKRLKNEQDQAR